MKKKSVKALKRRRPVKPDATSERSMVAMFPDAVLALKRAGVVKVVALYRARSGHINWEFRPLDSKERLVATVNVANAIAVEAECLIFFDQTVSARHLHWNLRGGSFGSFEWDIAQDRVIHIHNARVVNVTTFFHSGI